MEPVSVPLREFDFTEPWNIPEGCPPLVLSRAIDGSPARLATLVQVFRDPSTLYVLFSGVDASIVATRYERDDPLWEEDVLEVFIAPERRTRYFELEVSPIGTLFDAAIDSPEGERSTMKADRDWDAAGMWAAIRRVRRESGSLWRFETLVVIPFAALGRGAPAPGERWLANFYRIDRDEGLGDEYSAWQPTLRDPADFHVPGRFGELRFE
ncbi:MAG TPA: carbohydrate-binding family 9-like protein [Thermoanaerobaculia bacterium]|nr:carbohydrate-binding family 9-like protein [Thermoanaerobaculia bacterium]